MTENDREKIALFRYGLIAPILNGQVKNQKEYLQKQAAKTHNVPYYGPRDYVPKTIYFWLRNYRRGGFDALKPKRRTDKGKVERSFSTVKKRFLPLLDESDKSSLENLNQAFFRWLEQDYHRRKHSSLEGTPLDAYMEQISKVKTLDDPEKLAKIFLKRDKRKVKADGTISFRKKLFEVPPALIGKKIEIRFNPETADDVFIYDQGEEIAKAQPVNLHENAYLRREKNLKFHKLYHEGSED